MTLSKKNKRRYKTCRTSSNIKMCRTIQVCLMVLFIFFSTQGHAQIHFESGYFIDSTGERVDCLIRNSDWKNSPANFKYKLSENDEVKTGTPESVKEFAVGDQFKFISRKVEIDRSRSELKRMSRSRQPAFEKEHLFLEALVEGKANLYFYTEDNLFRFFYNVDEGDITQLVYKPYMNEAGKVAENNTFRQQLWNDLQCADFTERNFNNLTYSRRSLINIFMAYSKCHDVEPFNMKATIEKRDLFNLTLRPGVRYASLKVENKASLPKPVDLGTQIGWRLGLEGEFVFPFNKNKWALAAEPTYQYFKSGPVSVAAAELVEREYKMQLQYESIEVPISLRHYFYLNQASKIYISASYLFDFPFKSGLYSYRLNGDKLYDDVKITDKNNAWAVGAGLKMLDNYSLEIRYQSSRDLFSKYMYWRTNYNQISLIAGYTLF